MLTQEARSTYHSVFKFQREIKALSGNSQLRSTYSERSFAEIFPVQPQRPLESYLAVHASPAMISEVKTS